jgi:hypothetical protein
VLPPYHIGYTRTNTLHALFINTVGESYAAFKEAMKKEYEHESGGRESGFVTAYMGTTRWEGKLDQLLGEITRYYIKYWHLHPHLDRKSAVVEATEYLQKHFEKKGDTKRLIDEMLQEKRMDALEGDLLALKTEEAVYEGKTVKVFVDNEDAQNTVTNFLIEKKAKWDKKNTLDIITAFHQYVNTLGTIQKIKFRPLSGIVPKQTNAYLDKLNKLAQKEEERQERNRKKEAKAAEAQAKKRQRVEEAKKSLEEKNTESSLISHDNTGTGGDKQGLDDAAKRKILQTLDGDNPEYRLPINKYQMVNNNNTLSAARRRRAPRDNEMNQAVGITKIITGITEEGTVDVNYTVPGYLWEKAISVRISNVVTSVMLFANQERAMVQQALPNHTRTVSSKSARVMAAIMMHHVAKSDDDLNKMKLHDNFDMKTFQVDLQNTASAWLPLIFTDQLHILECYYDLLISPKTIGGLNSASRFHAFDSFLSSKQDTIKQTGTQVSEITELLYAIVEQLDKKKQVSGIWRWILSTQSAASFLGNPFP